MGDKIFAHRKIEKTSFVEYKEKNTQRDLNYNR
jgi:hypothetical protein